MTSPDLMVQFIMSKLLNWPDRRSYGLQNTS